MTCVAAVIHEGDVWMAADSAGVAGMGMTVRKDPKIYRNGEFLIGYTTSFRMGQLLAFAFRPPVHEPDISVERYLITAFVDSMRSTFKLGGFPKTDNGAEMGGEFLLGYRGRLFTICSDYQVGEDTLPFAAVGCGADIARGSLYATTKLDPESRLRLALSAAEAFSAGVRRPFVLDVLRGS
jgi:hypothetical protein